MMQLLYATIMEIMYLSVYSERPEAVKFRISRQPFCFLYIHDCKLFLQLQPCDYAEVANT